MKRTLLIGVVSFAISVGVAPARAGTATSPEVRDPVGDANAVSAFSCATTTTCNAQTPAAVSGLDITKVWFTSGGGKLNINIEMADAVPAVPGLYFQVEFDIPGCSGNMQPSHYPGTTARGYRVSFNRPYSTATPNTLTSPNLGKCVAGVPVAGQSEVKSGTWTISGRTVTMTLAYSGVIRSGATLTGPWSLTAVGVTTIDTTQAGSSYTLV